jgi:preprotein translocase subunit SecE
VLQVQILPGVPVSEGNQLERQPENLRLAFEVSSFWKWKGPAMSVTEASQQANRAEMDPRRLVVVSYLVFGIILTLFLGRLVEMLMAQVGAGNTEIISGTGIKLADVLGFVITAGLAGYAWTNPRVKTLSLEVATELMRVTWPSWEDVRISTIAVVVASLVAAIILFGMDTLSYNLMVKWLPAAIKAMRGES